jgi:drug/metabolite transporter (DMT)-like permease
LNNGALKTGAFLSMFNSLRRALVSNAPLLFVLTTVFWAGNMTVGRWIAGQVPPVTLAFLRWAGATIFILPFAWGYVAREWPTVRANWPVLLVLGVTGSGLFNTFQYAALVHTTATSAGIIYASGPIMIALMSHFLNGERIAPLQFSGIALSLLGVVLVLTHGVPLAIAHQGFNRGDVIMLLAVVIWAFYTAYLTRRPRLHAMTFAAVTYAIAALINLPMSAIELAGGAVLKLTPETGLAILYVAIFPSLVAYLCYNRGVEIIGPAKAGIYMNLVPLLAALFGIVFLGEQPALYHAAGFAFILLGVALVSRGK